MIDKLPEVRGKYVEKASLADITWFRVGGPSDVLFLPEDADDLASFLRECPSDIPITVVGVGSNLLVRDGGVRGVVIRLGSGFSNIEVDGKMVRAGAAALDASVAKVAQRAGLAGLEFYGGIPGTIGGALRMNAGSYGRETKDVLEHCLAMDRDGEVHKLYAEEMGFTYRHCSISEEWIFTEGSYVGTPDDPENILARMNEVTTSRQSSQPVRARTGGSTFKNPDPDISGGLKSWELIDAAGCRGLKIGGAKVSEKHCNFLINEGDAKASDLEQLGEEVRARVAAQSGIDLSWEIRRIGEELAGGI